jgi:TolB-like protein/DNA-binding winged helix-turn-helix (wHTH) protein
MDQLARHPRLRVGEWCVDQDAGRISRNGETFRLEARTMRLLVCLADRHGEVVSVDELLERVWSGVVVTPDSVYQVVASLRRTLGDDSRQPTYIATVPRLGYRMVAPVSPWTEPATGEGRAPLSTRGRRRMLMTGAAAGVVLISALLVFLTVRGAAAPPEKSVAVLAFLDLTEEMDQEYFGDAMTEDLVDRLSKSTGLRVSPPRSSFSFKGKQATVGEIAAALGVNYVLDGSLQESGSTLRVTARLVLAEGEFILWSKSYERPLDDLSTIHDDIAGHVVNAMK